MMFRLKIGSWKFRDLAVPWLAAVGVVSSSAWAQKPPNISAGEMALIPAYCPDTMGFGYGDAYYNTSPRAPYWVSRMGQGFWAIHHYCWALINLNRALRMSSATAERVGTLKKVLGDYLYVIEHTKADFVLLPEVFTRLGDVQLLLNDVGSANDAYAKARALKPDYWPAYAQWAEFLVKKGLRADALKVIETGLQHAPDARPLADLYRSLGQDPSKVKALQAPAPPVPAAVPETPASAPVAGS